MNNVKTMNFVFPDFKKALQYKETQLLQYQKLHPRTTAEIGVMERDKYCVSFNIRF